MAITVLPGKSLEKDSTGGALSWPSFVWFPEFSSLEPSLEPKSFESEFGFEYKEYCESSFVKTL